MDDILEIYNSVNRFGKWNGMHFTIPEPGKVEYRFTPEKHHESSPGVMHGGALAGYMDAVLGLAALSRVSGDGFLVSTVELKMNFLRPVKTGDRLKGQGSVMFQGKRLLVSTAVITNQHGEEVAVGQGTFNTYPVEKSAVASLYPTS